MTANKEPKTIPAEKLGLYDQLVATIPNLERKGNKLPYTSLNGHMFSYLADDGTLALRLPDETREKFLTKYKTTLREAYGIVQKEYVVVPDKLLRKTSELAPYLFLSYAYIKTLKTKPTTKRIKTVTKRTKKAAG